MYHDPKTHEWYDTVMVIYDFQTAQGPAKAYYQTQTTNGSQGYFENFMGDQGTLLISESELNYAGKIYRDPNAPAWDDWIQKGYITQPKMQEAKSKEDTGAVGRRARIRSRLMSTACRSCFGIPYHQPHLQNFFDAVRGKGKLNCPSEVAYESAVAVLKVNDAVEANARLAFSPDEFKI